MVEKENTLRIIGKPSQAQERTHLLGRATQQLRLPLTTLQLQLQLLARSLQRAKQLTAAQLGPRLQILQNQARRLAEIVDATDDLARVLQGALLPDLRPVPMDLAHVVRSIAERASEQAKDQGCEIIVQADTPVWGDFDPARVERIVWNLVSNGLVHAAGKPIRIIAAVHGQWGHIDVRDSGPGIRDVELNRLNLALQVPERTQTGAGLGLWLSAHLARAMKGTLHGLRVEGGGTLFRLELPLAPGAASDTVPKTNDAERGRS